MKMTTGNTSLVVLAVSVQNVLWCRKTVSLSSFVQLCACVFISAVSLGLGHRSEVCKLKVNGPRFLHRLLDPCLQRSQVMQLEVRANKEQS